MDRTVYAWAAIGAYVLATSYLAYRGYRKTKSLESFAVGSRDIAPWVVGLSLAAQLTSVATFVVNPGLIYAYGLSGIMGFGFAAAAGVMIGLLVFSGSFRRIGSQVTALTVPQWVGARYKSKSLAVGFAVLSLALVSFSVLIVTALSQALHVLTGQPAWVMGLGVTVFVYTYARENIAETEAVIERLVDNDCKVTFNMFSAPVGYSGPLRHDHDSLAATRRSMLALVERYPEHVLFSPYSAVAHTHAKGLHDLYKCSYPRMNPSTHIGLGRSFRQYRTDLDWDRAVACCVPDTDCPDCRHYAAGSAVVTARLQRHAIDPEHFRAWLDYVDNYLAVWVMGYQKGANLQPTPVAPPGFDLAPAG